MTAQMSEANKRLKVKNLQYRGKRILFFNEISKSILCKRK